MKTWTFSPCNLEVWNSAEERVLFVASEPNGDNPNGNCHDMGHWFRNAEKNNYYKNKQFFTRCEIILKGILADSAIENVFDYFRFMDLKATQGDSYANHDSVLKYVLNNISEVTKFFTSNDNDFGVSPSVIVLLGNTAQSIFTREIRNRVLNVNHLKWVGMPHPSHTVGYEGLEVACGNIIDHIKPINELTEKWVYKKDNYNIWKSIVSS